HVLFTQPLGGVRRVVAREKEAATVRQSHEFFARDRRHPVDRATNLDDALERQVTNMLRIGVLERAMQWRRRRSFRAACRKEKHQGHDVSCAPAGSKKAPCVMRAPFRKRSTVISTRVPASERLLGTQASPITSPTTSLRRALVTRPAGTPSMTTCAPSAG